MHPGVLLHLSDKRPVGLALVHLASGAAVDGQCRDSRILQPLRERYYYLGTLIPSEPGLDSHRFAYGFHDPLRYHHHLVRLAHHSRTGAAARNLVDRTAEIYVNDIAAMSSGDLVRIVGHFGCLHHRVRIIAVDLDCYRGLVFGGLHFRYGLGGVPYQPVGRNEFCINHIRAEFLAHDAERRVCHVFHRSQQDRLLAQVNVSNLHSCRGIVLLQNFRFQSHKITKSGLNFVA